jgi:hypothetical protein
MSGLKVSAALIQELADRVDSLRLALKQEEVYGIIKNSGRRFIRNGGRELPLDGDSTDSILLKVCHLILHRC